MLIGRSSNNCDSMYTNVEIIVERQFDIKTIIHLYLNDNLLIYTINEIIENASHSILKVKSGITAKNSYWPSFSGHLEKTIKLKLTKSEWNDFVLRFVCLGTTVRRKARKC